MSTTTDNRVRYSGFTRPGSVGLGDTSMSVTIFWMLDLAATISLSQFLPAPIMWVLWGQVVLIALLNVIKDEDGFTLWTRVSRKIKYTLFSAAGVTAYQATFVGSKPLTGPLSKSKALEYRSGHGKPFVLISHPYAKQYAAVFKASPVGGERHDRRHKDQMTANWGAVSAWLGNIRNARQLAVHIESAPRLQAESRYEMESFIAGDANPTAAAVTAERIQMGVEHYAGNLTHVVVTFDAFEDGNSDADRQKNALAIAQLIPTIQQRLNSAGAGRVEPISERDIAEYMRAAIDPQSRPLIEEARAAGADTGIDWNECGPVSMRPVYDYVVHDQAFSQTVLMTKAPQGAITDDILANIIRPSANIEIKRVALIKQIIDTGRANAVTTRDQINAEIREQTQKRSGTARKARKIAQRNSDALADGFGLEDFMIAATITVTDGDRLKDAMSAFRAQAGHAGVRFRTAINQQVTMFYYTCPLGLDLHAHSASEEITRFATSKH